MTVKFLVSMAACFAVPRHSVADSAHHADSGEIRPGSTGYMLINISGAEPRWSRL